MPGAMVEQDMLSKSMTCMHSGVFARNKPSYDNTNLPSRQSNT